MNIRLWQRLGQFLAVQLELAGFSDCRQHFVRNPFAEFLRCGLAGREDERVKARLADSNQFLFSARGIISDDNVSLVRLKSRNGLCDISELQNAANVGSHKPRRAIALSDADGLILEVVNCEVAHAGTPTSVGCSKTLTSPAVSISPIISS